MKFALDGEILRSLMKIAGEKLKKPGREKHILKEMPFKESL